MRENTHCLNAYFFVMIQKKLVSVTQFVAAKSGVILRACVRASIGLVKL